MVIVHTTVWIDYLRGAENPETRWLDRELRRNRLGLTDLILCEVLQGIRDASGFSQVRSDLLKFQVFQTGGSIWPSQPRRTIATCAGKVTTSARLSIASLPLSVLQAQLGLLHRDHDFDPFEKVLGLKVVHPSP